MHAHKNLSLAVANSIAAYEEGARNLDGTSAGLGAGAGNCPTEILAAVCEKNGIVSGVDPLALMDVAEEIIRPLMSRQQVVDRAGLLLGYAGVYGSSCCTPSAPPSATASRRRRSCSSSAPARSWAGRRT